jgi:hypothetical protein
MNVAKELLAVARELDAAERAAGSVSPALKVLVADFIDDTWTTAESAHKVEAKRNLKVSREKWNGAKERMEYTLKTTWKQEEDEFLGDEGHAEFFVTIGMEI